MSNIAGSVKQVINSNLSRWMIAYFVALTGILLYPFGFESPVTIAGNDVHWIQRDNGVEFSGRGVIRSVSSTKEFGTSLMHGTGITVEVWMQTSDINQSGPARILSYSYDPWLRNFTLGQEERDLVLRLRTTKTNLDGSNPELRIGNFFLPNEKSHILISYDFVQTSIYKNGVLRLQVLSPGGDFDNWDISYPLLIGNENTGNRPWRGSVYLVACYNRCLSASEVERNYRAGSSIEPPNWKDSGRVREGLITLYPFTEGKGGLVRDESGSRSAPSLFIPGEVRIPKQITGSYKKLLNVDIAPVIGLRFKDILLNVLGFIPFGFFLHGILKKKKPHYKSIVLVAIVITGTLFSLIIESLQYYINGRESDLYDVASNAMGVFIGVFLGKRVLSKYIN
jgi:hypothetical protein